MQPDPFENTDGTLPLSTMQSAIAIIPFLLFGLASLASRLEILRTFPVHLPLWQILITHPFLVFNWLILLGLAVGIVLGFPRWTFSYLGWAILFAWWWTNMGFYGYVMHEEIWLPLLFILVISLLIRRSVQPLRIILTSLWRDLTLLAFGVYILYTWVYILADENHHPYLTLFILASTLAACVGAWGFFRSASPLRRVLALIAGFILAVLIGFISEATWDSSAYYGLPERANNINLIGILLLFVLVGFMLFLGWVTRWRQRKSIPHR